MPGTLFIPSFGMNAIQKLPRLVQSSLIRSTNRDVACDSPKGDICFRRGRQPALKIG